MGGVGGMSEQPAQPIKVISLYQPWASLMACGAKVFETRTWGTKFRGLVIIHASKTLEVDWRNTAFIKAMREAGIKQPEKLPLGMALAVGELVGCYKAETVSPHINEHERLFGNYADGRVAWKFENMRLFAKPVPARGQQYLWDWKEPLPELMEPVPF